MMHATDRSIVGFVAVVLSILPTAGGAAPLLVDYGINVNGLPALISEGDPVPAGVDDSGLDLGTGLGTITVSLSGAGAHQVVALFDHDFGGFFDDEYGLAPLTPPADWSWQIDDPFFGDIVANWNDSAPGASLLDDTNHVPLGAESDVSLALGIDLILAADESALVEFLVTTALPTTFYLGQADDDAGEQLYLSAAVTITRDGPGGGPGDGPGLPLPSPLLLLGGGVGLLLIRRRR